MPLGQNRSYNMQYRGPSIMFFSLRPFLCWVAYRTALRQYSSCFRMYIVKKCHNLNVVVTSSQLHLCYINSTIYNFWEPTPIGLDGIRCWCNGKEISRGAYMLLRHSCKVSQIQIKEFELVIYEQSNRSNPARVLDLWCFGITKSLHSLYPSNIPIVAP